MRVRFVVLLTVAISVCVIACVAQAGSAAESAAGTKPPSVDISSIKTKAEAGDSSASYELGRAYETGTGVREDPAQAAIWYRKAADQGNAKAQNSLGVLYWIGNGVDRNKIEAVKWYRKAARQGDASAMFNIGAAYYNGEGVNANDTLAYAWFILSSEAGSSSGRDAAQRTAGEHRPTALGQAYFAIGKLYETGEDLSENRELAANWYQKAADQGYSEAKVALALLWIKARDYGEARRWCEAAAKDRNPGGAFCLGHLYQNGLGVDKNAAEARKWYEESAQGGSPQAMQVVGQMYEKGEGVKMDRPQAFVWLFYSARRGNREAIAAASQLRSSMTEKEWKDAQKKLRQRNFDLKQIDVVLQGGSERGQLPPR